MTVNVPSFLPSFLSINDYVESSSIIPPLAIFVYTLVSFTAIARYVVRSHSSLARQLTQSSCQVALPLMCAIRVISKQLTMVDPSVWEQVKAVAHEECLGRTQ